MKTSVVATKQKSIKKTIPLLLRGWQNRSPLWQLQHISGDSRRGASTEVTWGSAVQVRTNLPAQPFGGLDLTGRPTRSPIQKTCFSLRSGVRHFDHFLLRLNFYMHLFTIERRKNFHPLQCADFGGLCVSHSVPRSSFPTFSHVRCRGVEQACRAPLKLSAVT